MRHLVRMYLWAKNPPSPQRVKFVFGIVALCAVIAGVEWLGLWPDWATAQKMRRP